MSKKTLPLILLWVLLLSLFSQSVSTTKVTIPNQDHFIRETIDEPESVDPAWAIDTASRILIFNVYDTLVFFDRESVGDFVPYLATEWLINQPPDPTAPAGTDSTWYFKIREGVQWQDPAYGTLTTEDVEYSFERLMVMDRSGGPAWKIYEPLLGVYHAGMGWPEAPGNPIDTAVESNSTHVWFNLAMPYPPFMQILSGSWASIVNKEFCVANGDWSGEWVVTGEGVGTGDGAATVFTLDSPPVVVGSETIYFGPVLGEAVGTGDGATTVFYLAGFPVVNGSETIDLDVTNEAVGTGDNTTTVFYLDSPPVVEGSETIYLDVTGEAVGTGDNVTTVFYLDYPPVVEGSEKIYLNETLQTRDVDYTIDYAIGNITFATAPDVGVVITADYQQDIDYAIDYLTGEITFDNAPGAGVVITADYQQDIDHTMNYTTGEITFTVAPGVGVVITADYQQDIDHTMNYATGEITFTPAPGVGVVITADYTPSWIAWLDPPISPIDAAGNVMMGTGPYKLDYWSHGVEWSIIRHADYWGGWPAPHSSRYLDRVTNKVVYGWGTRYADFIGGFADQVYVPRAYLPQMILNWPTKWNPGDTTNPEVYAEGIRGLPGLPTLAIDAAMFFTFDTNPASPYVGTGTLDGDGIPLDFFSDVRIRQAFAYSFDYTEFLDTMFWGEAVQPSSPIINGILYHNPANPTYNLNLTRAAELFQEASADSNSPAYGVWTSGFNMTITFNTGNVPRQTTAEMLRDGVTQAFADYGGATVEITVLGLPGPTFEGELVGYPTFRSLMPLFITGKLAEYPDPHDFVHSFMHTYGHFSYFQSYSNATVDALIELGIRTPDGPGRQAIYHMLQLMYYQDVPSVCSAQPLKRHWERDWVQGWYYNPLYPGQKYFKHLWKGLTGDINGDNRVGILDVGKVSAHWSMPPFLWGPLGYDVIADIGPVLQYPTPEVINIVDAGVISAHYGEEVDS